MHTRTHARSTARTCGSGLMCRRSSSANQRGSLSSWNAYLAGTEEQQDRRQVSKAKGAGEVRRGREQVKGSGGREQAQGKAAGEGREGIAPEANQKHGRSPLDKAGQKHGQSPCSSLPLPLPPFLLPTPLAPTNTQPHLL